MLILNSSKKEHFYGKIWFNFILQQDNYEYVISYRITLKKLFWTPCSPVHTRHSSIEERTNVLQIMFKQQISPNGHLEQSFVARHRRRSETACQMENGKMEFPTKVIYLSTFSNATSVRKIFAHANKPTAYQWMGPSVRTDIYTKWMSHWVRLQSPESSHMHTSSGQPLCLYVWPCCTSLETGWLVCWLADWLVWCWGIGHFGHGGLLGVYTTINVPRCNKVRQLQFSQDYFQFIT